MTRNFISLEIYVGDKDEALVTRNVMSMKTTHRPLFEDLATAGYLDLFILCMCSAIKTTQDPLRLMLCSTIMQD